MDPLPMHAWHPLIVHFPLAFLLGGVALEAVGWLLGRPALRRAGAGLLVGGLLLALPAVVTGLLAYGRVDHSESAHELMKLHRNLALASVALLAFALLWRRGSARPGAPRAARLLYGALLALAAAGLVAVGEIGAKLVFENAVGIPSPSLRRILDERGEAHEHGVSRPPKAGERLEDGHPEGAERAAPDTAAGHAHEPGEPAHTHGEVHR